MPFYEYRCENGHQFEALQRMSDDALSACTTCDAPVQRLLFAPAIHFKGSGFHNTDYATKKRPRDSENGSSTTDGSSSASEGTAPASGDSGTASGTKEATPKDTAARATGP
ncbi:MAG: zinc ribbon domain-containing protein [Actinobacteria bacterium]|nr:zinc ribbon domain-containing protein [Actinomycetota bacterium]